MKRVATDYAVTRAQKRYIARQVAKAKQNDETKHVLEERNKLEPYERHIVPKGEKFFKHYYNTIRRLNFVSQERVGSKFSKNWRAYKEEASF